MRLPDNHSRRLGPLTVWQGPAARCPGVERERPHHREPDVDTGDLVEHAVIWLLSEPVAADRPRLADRRARLEGFVNIG